MKKNNFQRLEKEDFDRVPKLNLIANRVQGRLNNMRLFGNVVDLYLAKVIDVFVMMTGGDVDTSKKYPSETLGRKSPTEPDEKKPTGPGNI